MVLSTVLSPPSEGHRCPPDHARAPVVGRTRRGPARSDDSTTTPLVRPPAQHRICIWALVPTPAAAAPEGNARWVPDDSATPAAVALASSLTGSAGRLPPPPFPIGEGITVEGTGGGRAANGRDGGTALAPGAVAVVGGVGGVRDAATVVVDGPAAVAPDGRATTAAAANVGRRRSCCCGRCQRSCRCRG